MLDYKQLKSFKHYMNEIEMANNGKEFIEQSAERVESTEISVKQ